MDILASGKGRGKMSLYRSFRHVRGAQVQLYAFLNTHDPATLHPRKSHQYPLTRRLGGPKTSWYFRGETTFRGEITLLSLSGIDVRTVQPIAKLTTQEQNCPGSQFR